MKRYVNPRGTLFFVLLAVALMIILDMFVLGGWKYFRQIPGEGDLSHLSTESLFTAVEEQNKIEEGGAPDILRGVDITGEPVSKESLLLEPEELKKAAERVYAQDYEWEGSSGFAMEEEGLDVLARSPEPGVSEPAVEPAPLGEGPEGSEYEYRSPSLAPGEPFKIAVIIDDLGMDREHSLQVIDITDAPLTLAFLPYAPDLERLTQRAKDNGHELLIHMPMEPLSDTADPGPGALREGMTPEHFDTLLEVAFNAFDGYIGINNHMGSKLTRNEPLMARVMAALKARDLIFVDSKTIHDSVAATMARRYGLDYAERDVFLDHQDTGNFIKEALKKLEEIAVRRGYAVAIGHPRIETIKNLRAWIPTLKARGFEIVPVSEVLNTPVMKGPVVQLAPPQISPAPYDNLSVQ